MLIGIKTQISGNFVESNHTYKYFMVFQHISQRVSHLFQGISHQPLPWKLQTSPSSPCGWALGEPCTLPRLKPKKPVDFGMATLPVVIPIIPHHSGNFHGIVTKSWNGHCQPQNGFNMNQRVPHTHKFREDLPPPPAVCGSGTCEEVSPLPAASCN